MKKLMRKAITVLGSAALVGATMGAAAAASYPTGFTSSAAVVVGTGANPTDNTAAMNIRDDLSDGMSTTTLTGASGVTEDQVALGSNINATGKLASGAALTDSKVPSLLDTKLNWDDGGPSGADDYNIHEEIRLGTMAIRTTFDDNDFEGVALTNDKQLEYRLVFDDAFNVTADEDIADDLYLSILGKEYEIADMTTTTITVVTSEEVTLSKGDSVTVDGVTFTVEDLSATAARVNGETVTTSAKKVDGVKVQVKTGSIFYNENFPEEATVTLKIGEEISKTYSAGEEYIGEDEDDPQWVWTFSNPGAAGGYIGVKYNQKETRDTDDIVYVGGSYMLPENFGEVKLDGLTDVDYSDFKMYFDDAEDLWNSTDLTSTAQVQDTPVFIIESVDGVKDSIKLTSGGQETSKIYLRWANSTQEIQGTQANASLEVYYSDVDNTVDEVIRPRFKVAYSASTNNSAASSTMANADLGDLIIGDTTIGMNASVVSGNLKISFTNGIADIFTVDLGGVALNGSEGSLLWFGGNTEATDKEDGLAGDMLVGGTSVGTYDNDIMLRNGTIIQSPEANLDNDEVIISVPNDVVYAIVSVVAGGEASASEAGVKVVKDTEAASVAGKNLIVVGGSAINAVAADLLGGAYSEGDFTAQTGVGAGEYLIQSFKQTDGTTAILVAGYNAEDTSKAYNAFLNSDVDLTAPAKYVSQATTVSSTDLVAA